jgi:hypothetical protein
MTAQDEPAADRVETTCRRVDPPAWGVAALSLAAGALTGFGAAVHMPLESGRVAAYQFALSWFGLPVWETWVATQHDADRLISLWRALYLLGLFAYGPAAVVAWRAGRGLFARRPGGRP